ncbi:hypothetical protein G7Y89_g11034 [Cudoniella acicularis]|uniref:Copper acquisition factor BIM1-like domain-containing protein n=1 Tax=Cudoniella acicularis TaxID=354080 RepID=A0A8H4VY75_9HELO|nr:hypothetical protein G7Y89_g11034 [Cudoniella acicularis]
MMLFQTLQFVAIVSLAALTEAHFVLQIPTSLGFNDGLEATGPCDTFSPTDRTTVTNWPIGGDVIQVLTTHNEVIWNINAALLNAPSTFVPLVPSIDQKGVGTFCLPSVPGNAAWVGQDAILQVIQNGVDGKLYQCAAIKFVDGPTGSVPSSCINSTGVSAVYVGGGTSSSSSAVVVTPASSSSAIVQSPSAVAQSSSSSVSIISSGFSTGAGAGTATGSSGTASTGAAGAGSGSGSGSSTTSTLAFSTGSSSGSGSGFVSSGAAGGKPSNTASSLRGSSTSTGSSNVTTPGGPVQFTGSGSLIIASNAVLFAGAALAAWLML